MLGNKTGHCCAAVLPEVWFCVRYCGLQSFGKWESRKGRWKLLLEVCGNSSQRQGALPGKRGAEGKAAEILGSRGGAEGAERFSSTLELWC